ncbi:MAG: ABC transporter ATP-binding protein [Betaproteobacteria bacterium]|nr:ABC transporter ATP-binding protein [Betaproteobacteria bacterium]
MSSEPAIRVSNLSKCYQIYDRPQDRLKQSLWRGRKQFYREFRALHDVSFEVMRGQTVGIVGRNGSGKSTLLQLIAGTLTPTSGSVAVGGRIAALLELGSGFNPDFTGRENVYMNGAILGLGRAEIDRRFDDITAFADIGEFIDQPVKTYSSGMMVRLAFSVSVNVEPDILIVDEALAVGDAAFQFKCLERLERLTASGTTLLFASHSMDMIKNFCDHAIYLRQGVKKASGSPEEIGELYLLEAWQEQTRSQAGEERVALKPSLKGAEGMAFGTEEGRVLRAGFAADGGLFAVCALGQRIAFETEVEFQESVANPHLSVIVQDRRTLQVGGQTFAIPRRPAQAGLCRASVRCDFEGHLAAGRYFVTLRLEDRRARDVFYLIDKQVGLLSFEIVAPERKPFLGLVDLGISFAEVEGKRAGWD